MQFVEEKTKIPFSRKEESLQEGLYKHLVGMINRVKSNIQIVNPLKETVKKITAIYMQRSNNLLRLSNK
jgi:transcriptional antiterminator